MRPPQPAVDRIAIVSDEAAPDFGAAVNHCLPLGISAFELRCLGGDRLPWVSESALLEVESTVERTGVRLLGISPGFAKRPLNDPGVAEEMGEPLAAAFRLLERLGIRCMTVFSYLRGGDREAPIPGQAFDLMGAWAERCRTAGVEMLIENSAQCWGNTGANLAAVARGVGVRVVWDPANAQTAGEAAYPDGYAAVRDRVAHVHLKNWSPAEGCVYLGKGQARLQEQVAALQADGYPGYYCLENHRPRDPQATAVNLRYLRGWLQEGAARA
jgi:L-ribulose-5-phosphate 3-epimerase